MLTLSRPTRAADLEKFLPKDTDAVLSVNLQQIIESSVFKKNALDRVKDLLAKNKEVQMGMAATGLDPMKDFERISIGMNIDDPKLPKFIVIVEGKFDPKKIKNTLDEAAKNEPAKVSTSEVNGKTIYKFMNADRTSGYGAVLDPRTIVFGTSKELISSSFDAAQGTAKSEIPKEFSELLAKADSKSSCSFVAIIRGKLEKLPLGDPNIKKVLQQIYYVTLDVKAERDIDLKLNIGLETAEAAKSFEALAKAGLQGVKAQVKIAAANTPELQPFVELANSLDVFARGKSAGAHGCRQG